MNYKSRLLNVINLLQCYNFLLLNDRNFSFCTGDSEGKWSWQLTPIQILLLCSDMMFPSFWLSSGCICSCCASFPYPAVARLLWHTHIHKPRRWKEKSSSITCITASCSDQLTTTKCPRKSIFSPWDLSAVLTSNFIFIDHSLFSSI